jgi:hypothetical protein
MSARKFSKDSQRAQTVMPRPPYRENEGCGPRHRFLMHVHTLYSGDR